MTDQPAAMTTAEVASLLRTPAETVRYWRHVEKGPKWYKVGRRVLYARADVEAFLAEAKGEEVAADDHNWRLVTWSSGMETFTCSHCDRAYRVVDAAK